MKKAIFWTPLAICTILAASACSSGEYKTWREEVILSDGSKIFVDQKRRCDGAYNGQANNACIAREAWLTVYRPELSERPIEWHEHLHPMIVNLFQGKLYVVGDPPTEREFHLYGSPRPAYIGFVWEADHWRQLKFSEIPPAIYDTNLLIAAFPPEGITALTVERKAANDLNGDWRIPKQLKQVDPAYESNFN